MFCAARSSAVEFGSSWRQQARKLERISAEVQTLQPVLADVAVQSFSVQSVQTQTTVESTSKSSTGVGDLQALVELLKTHEAIISSALIQNLNSNAFDGWDVDGSAVQQQLQKNIDTFNVLHMLVPLAMLDDEPALRPLYVVWNKSGSTIAISYGRPAHEAWCVHQGYICIWHLNNRRFSPTKPSTVLEMASCVTCLAFHPTQAHLLFAGSFAGNVYLWDCSPDLNEGAGHLIAQSSLGPDTHEEPVSACQWMPMDVGNRLDADSFARGTELQVLTCGYDGRILVWNMLREECVPIAKAQILALHIPTSEQLRPLSVIASGRRARGSTSTARVSVPIGLSTCSIPSDPLATATLLFGTESGYVFHCTNNKLSSLDTRNSTTHSLTTGSSRTTAITVNPIQFMYPNHFGHVSTVAFHPTIRGLFATSGRTDGLVRICALFQKTPLLILELPPIAIAKTTTTEGVASTGVTSLSWSPVRATILAVTTASHLDDSTIVKTSQLFPVQTLLFDDMMVTGDKSAIYSDNNDISTTTSHRPTKKADDGTQSYLSSMSAMPSSPTFAGIAPTMVSFRPTGRDVCVMTGETRGPGTVGPGSCMVVQIQEGGNSLNDVGLQEQLNETATMKALMASREDNDEAI